MFDQPNIQHFSHGPKGLCRLIWHKFHKNHTILIKFKYILRISNISYNFSSNIIQMIPLQAIRHMTHSQNRPKLDTAIAIFFLYKILKHNLQISIVIKNSIVLWHLHILPYEVKCKGCILKNTLNALCLVMTIQALLLFIQMYSI